MFTDWNEYDLALKSTVIVSIVLLAALIVFSVVAFIVMRKKQSAAFTTRDLAFGAICLAIAFALGFIGFKMPQGGTVTPASSLPIMLFCYFFGFRKGIIVCVAYMFLQFLQSPYIVHPMSAVLDYVVPYLALIFFAVFSARRFKTAATVDNKNVLKNNLNFLLGAACYIAVRYLSHVLSGIIFYSENAWYDWGSITYSLVYNSFFLVDAAIAVVLGFAVMSNRAIMRYMLPNEKKKCAPEQQGAVENAN